MSIKNFFDQPHDNQNREYFVHLVRIAMADDIINNTELELLHRLGRKMGFTNPEIESLIKSTGKSDFIPPYEFSKRFEQLYDIVKMTLSDGTVDEKEMRLAGSFAIKSGFEEKEITKLLTFVIAGIKQGKDEEDLFEDYKKERRNWV